jgi:homogentisate 1,2-dioxygenase
LPGALPVGANSPQKTPFGLYAEQVSGTAFTAPRSENRRSWVYRLRPSAHHGAFTAWDKAPLLKTAPTENEGPVSANRHRWSPMPLPTAPTDFVEGLTTYATNGDVNAGQGIGIHLYAANKSMQNRVFFNADGELLIVPQEGRLKILTEMGILEIEPLQIAIIPRGIKFRVELPDGKARGYVAENYGHLLRLPDLGPIGANGLANPRDFTAPRAWFEDRDESFEMIQKFQGSLWSVALDHSPLDVVAWHGNLAPMKYDLRHFNTINTVSFDHPDPSIFTVLTSPSDSTGVANLDFVIFPSRWMVAENTFRPPWFHRNVMSEFMGLLTGRYDAKEAGFSPGGVSLHNCMNAHGPDLEAYEKAVNADLKPMKIENTMAFMFESRMVIRPTKWALDAPHHQLDYDDCWKGFQKGKLPQ